MDLIIKVLAVYLLANGISIMILLLNIKMNCFRKKVKKSEKILNQIKFRK